MPTNENSQPQNQDINLEYTGERHIFGQPGVDLLSFANLEHMIRYAFIAPFVKGKRVLDITCGSGYGTQYIALQGASQVIGVDIDQDSINYAQKYHNHESIIYIQSDAHHVKQLEDDAFDVIISFETIEHLQRPRDFLYELRKLLKPNGQLFISCPNDYRITPWISEFHLQKFKFEEFRDLIVSIFGEATFLGQHHTLATCLTQPVVPNQIASHFQNYKNSPPHNFFHGQYLEHLSSIENADGYLGIFGVELSLINNSLSVSQNAFQAIMHQLTVYEKKANQAVQDVYKLQETSQQEILNNKESWQKELEGARDKYQKELEMFQEKSRMELQLNEEKFKQTLELYQQQAQLEQQKVQIELDNYRKEFQIELEASKVDIKAKGILIDALEEKLKVLEERYGKLLREKFNAVSTPAILENEIAQLESSLSYAQTRIAAMETSKFWKLRKKWFEFKRSMNIPGNE